jgi:HD superfamily phosphodiesterase
VPASYALARELVDAHPEADPDIVLPAILLHDNGYALVPEDDLLRGLAGGAVNWDPAITRLHEVEGARLAGEILAELGWDPARTRAIQEIIDGHDSRTEALSLDDALVKDADKLWRFTESGVRVSHVWMQLEPEPYTDFLEARVDDWLFTETAREIAHRELAATRAALAAGPVR